MFSCEYCEIFKTNNFEEHLRTAASEARIRGCLHVQFHPGMEYPCLWWNVSYCLHVLAEMKFHPRKNSSWDERQGWKKEKKTCKHFILGWNFKMSMFFLICMYSSMFSKFSCLNIKIPLHERISNKNISKFIARLSFFLYSPVYFI